MLERILVTIQGLLHENPKPPCNTAKSKAMTFPPPHALVPIGSGQQLQPLKQCSFPSFVRAEMKAKHEGEWGWV